MRKIAEFFLRNNKKKPNDERQGGVYIFKSKEEASAIIITALGVDSNLLEEIIVRTKRKLSRKVDCLIYLTDSPDFAIFRRHGVIFEYLPSSTKQRLHATDMPWQAYLQERWGLLLAKWRPRYVLTYGTSIDSFLAAAPASSVRRSPDMPKS